MKKKLAIDIDEILRAKWLAFDRFYAEEFGEENIKLPFDTYDLKNHYVFKDTEMLETYLKDEFLEDEKLEKLSPTEYVINEETGKAAVDDFIFKSESKTMTADELYNKFLYEDYVFEIHGSCPKTYINADVDLMKFMKLYENYFDFIFFSKTKKEAISPTLFFLSKMRLVVKNISFVYENNEILDQVDWILTTDPSFMDTNYDKKIIKFKTPYNENNSADYEINSIKLLIEDLELSNNFEEFIKSNI